MRRPQASATQDGRGGDLDLGALESLVGYRLRRAQVAVFADFAASVGQGGMTPGLAGLIALIAANPGLKQSALALLLGVDRSTLVPALDKLEARGLVARRPMAGDRRAHALELTDKGQAVWAKTLGAIRAHEARVLRGFSAAEKATLIRLLGRLGRDAPARPGARGRPRRKP
jgi:DNA-binding MarR family transcriptional regulator